MLTHASEYLRPVLFVALTGAALASGCTPSDPQPSAPKPSAPKPSAPKPTGTTPDGATSTPPQASDTGAKANEPAKPAAVPPPKDVTSLIDRLAADKARQEANAPKPVEIKIPDAAQVERQVEAVARALVTALANGDADAATALFLGDDEVPQLFSTTFSRLLASTRGDLNVREWETFRALSEGKKVEYTGVETVRPSVADPKSHPLYLKPVLFLDSVKVDTSIGGRPFQLNLKHLIHRDGKWKILQFTVIDPDVPVENGGN